MNIDIGDTSLPPGWWEDSAKRGEDFLRSIPYAYLSPTGRILVDMLDREEAEAAAGQTRAERETA